MKWQNKTISNKHWKNITHIVKLEFCDIVNADILNMCNKKYVILFSTVSG